MEKILEVENLKFQYGEITALRGISFYVEDGEIVTILGGNGAGKTTALQAVSGLIRGISGGEIRFMGEKITGMAPHKIAALGIAQCIEGRHIFSQLTVRENLMMGAYLRKGDGIGKDLEYVYHLFPRLKERESQQGGTLSGGEQQMLAVGRALMQRPRLLMMDEPSLGLAPLIVEDIFRAVKQIKEDGIPVLLVEQNCNVALAAAKRGYVMETGEILFQDTAERLMENTDIQRSYMGIS